MQVGQGLGKPNLKPQCLGWSATAQFIFGLFRLGFGFQLPDFQVTYGKHVYLL